MRHVLIIDDEPDIRAVAELSFDVTGEWEVTTAASGPAGLERAIDVRPDVILLDVMMPGEDGVETLERIRAHPVTASIPVVLLTAKVQATDLRRYETLPAVGVLPKPFDPVTLPDSLDDLLGV